MRKDGMTAKRKIQIITDTVMTVLLPILMAYELVGQAAHEWIGIGMFALFILHNVLNRKWYTSLFKGRYTSVRTFITVIDLLLLVVMVSLMVSGIMLSRHAFAFLSLNNGASFARILHLLASYWGFALMSVHLGSHWNMLMGMARKIFPCFKASTLRKTILRVICVLGSLYGGYSFIQRGIGSYMLLQNQFVFFDFSEPLIFFLIDYLAVMWLFAAIGHYIMALFQYLSKIRRSKKDISNS